MLNTTQGLCFFSLACLPSIVNALLLREQFIGFNVFYLEAGHTFLSSFQTTTSFLFLKKSGRVF